MAAGSGIGTGFSKLTAVKAPLTAHRPPLYNTTDRGI